MIWTIWIVIVLALTIAAIALVYFRFAPANLFWTFVEEGYYKIVGKGTAVYKFILSLGGKTFDDEWNVVLENRWVKDGRELKVEEVMQEYPRTKEDKRKHRVRGKVKIKINDKEAEIEAARYKEPWHPFGGLRLYGIYPFSEILKFRKVWDHLHPDGEIKHHDEGDLDADILKIDLYVVQHKLKKPVEDMYGVPMGVAWLMPMRIVNPYTERFVYRGGLTIINGVAAALIKNFVARFSYFDDLIDMVAGKEITERQKAKGIVDPKMVAKEGEDLRDNFWKELVERLEEKAVEERTEMQISPDFIRVFGVEIQRKGCEQLSIDPDPSYRELTTLAYKAEQEKKRRVITAEADKEAMAQETSKTLIKMLSDILGEKEDKVQAWLNKEMKDDPVVRKLVLEADIELIQQQLAVRGQGKGFIYIKAVGPGLTGLEPLIALAQKFTGGQK